MNTSVPGIPKPSIGDDCPFCGRPKSMVIDPENLLIHCLVCLAWWHHEGE